MAMVDIGLSTFILLEVSMESEITQRVENVQIGDIIKRIASRGSHAKTTRSGVPPSAQVQYPLKPNNALVESITFTV